MLFWAIVGMAVVIWWPETPPEIESECTSQAVDLYIQVGKLAHVCTFSESGKSQVSWLKLGVGVMTHMLYSSRLGKAPGSSSGGWDKAELRVKMEGSGGISRGSVTLNQNIYLVKKFCSKTCTQYLECKHKKIHPLWLKISYPPLPPLPLQT